MVVDIHIGCLYEVNEILFHSFEIIEDPTEKKSTDLLYFEGFGMVDQRDPSPEGFLIKKVRWYL